MKHITHAYYVMGCFILLSNAAHAGRFCSSCETEIKLGRSIANFSSEIRIDGETFGDTVDFEDDLGFSKEDKFAYASIEVKFAKRHRFNFIYSSYTRQASVSSSEDFRFGDDNLRASASINSESKSVVRDIEYSYDFYQRPKLDLAASLGLYWSSQEFELSAFGEVESDDSANETIQQNYRRTAQVDIPLPTLGLNLSYQLSHKWEFQAGIRAFKVEIENQEGRFRNLNAQVNYAISDNILLGFALTSRRLSVSASRDELEGKLKWSYHGADAFLIYRF